MLTDFVYPKVNSIFKRDEKSVYQLEFAEDAFDYLWDKTWAVYEKFDGFNCRVIWDAEKQTVYFYGKSNSTYFTDIQNEYLLTVFQSKLFKKYETMILFGEMIGKNSRYSYGLIEPKFILFDVFRWSTQRWQQRDFIINLADEFEIEYAPLLKYDSLARIVEEVKGKEALESALFKGFKMEGYILKPVIEFYKANNERIMTKIKFKDKFSEAFNY